MAIDEAFVVLVVSRLAVNDPAVVNALPFATLRGAKEAIEIIRRYDGLFPHLINDCDEVE